MNLNNEDKVKQQMKLAKQAKRKVKNEKKRERRKQQIDNLNSANIVSRKKIKLGFIIVLLLLLALIVRLFYLQIIDGEYLYELALKQQTTTEVISSKRGNIYDSTGTPLAISETVDTISINPSRIKGDNDEETAKLKETVAKGLSEIFELDYNETLEKVNSTSSVETIAKKVEEDKVNELREWMKENKISSAINIDEDSKRYYPYETLASQVIGFCGDDNQGLSGIEYSYDSILTGTSGQIVTSLDGSQSEIPNSVESFVEAEDGYNINLTININIQRIVEKYLKKAVEENDCSRGGNCIIMDPSTGEILAMASYPDYNLNSPNTATSYYADDWDSLDRDEKLSRLYEMWSVRSVSETYEPGSVFKLITSAIALEENITETDVENDFICKGVQKVEDRNISCWRSYNPHGHQTLREALENSCNPAFIQLGQRINTKTLYKYYDAFGLFSKTNVGLSGEATGVFFDEEDVGPVEKATMSFGQRFTITPLQMCTALCAIANDGYLLQPKIVKSMTNTDTGEVIETEAKTIRQVISSQTAEEICDMMQSVVEEGTGSHAAVKGYSVGGKSGTSEPVAGDPDAGYVASFAAITPVENTKLVVLVTLYDPQAGSFQGGQTAGPVVSQILSEVLPTLEIEPDQK